MGTQSRHYFKSLSLGYLTLWLYNRTAPPVQRQTFVLAIFTVVIPPSAISVLIKIDRLRSVQNVSPLVIKNCYLFCEDYLSIMDVI